MSDVMSNIVEGGRVVFDGVLSHLPSVLFVAAVVFIPLALASEKQLVCLVVFFL